MSYTGWTTDGKMFDSSLASKGPVEFPLNRLIKGWTEGLQLMVAGEKRRLWIPAKLAFGDTHHPSGYAEVYGDVVIDVELVTVDSSKRAIAMKLAQEQASQPPASLAPPQ